MTSKLPIYFADLLRQSTVEGDRIDYKAGWNRLLCIPNTQYFIDLMN